jgi:peptidoglycan/LPS O-acetylase OafA/YrhL
VARSRREPVALPRVPALDGLRVISALAVVVYHAMGAVLGSNPTAGVLMPSAAFLFFVISGYVIYRPFVAAHLAGNDAPALGRFYRARVLRVLPLWFLAVTAYVVVDGAAKLHGPGDWVATYLLVQYVVPGLRFAVIGPAWALSVEWLFYLSAPLLALAVRGGRRRWARRVAPVKAEAWVLAALFVTAWLVRPARPAVALVAGMALATFDVHRRRARRNPAWLRVLVGNGWLVVAGTAAAWVALAHYPYQEGLSVQWVERDPAVLAIWIATALLWFVPVAFGDPDREPQRTLASRWAVGLSQLTFGLYLWHQLVLDRVVDHLGRDAGFSAVLYLTLLGSILLAAATFALVERPGRELNRRAAARRGPLAAPEGGGARDPDAGGRSGGGAPPGPSGPADPAAAPSVRSPS